MHPRQAAMPFGPHEQLLQVARGEGGGSAQAIAEANTCVDSQRAGFSRLFLFTWLEEGRGAGGADVAPNVCIADLWMDGETSDGGMRREPDGGTSGSGGHGSGESDEGAGSSGSNGGESSGGSASGSSVDLDLTPAALA